MGSTYGDDYEDDGYWVSPTSDDDYDDGGYYGEDYGNDGDDDDNDDVGNFVLPIVMAMNILSSTT